MRKIKQLILYFPHGASVRECDEIAGKAQDEICAGISSGGFLPTNKYGTNVENVTFSEDTMMYEYGHNRLQEAPSPSKKEDL